MAGGAHLCGQDFSNTKYSMAIMFEHLDRHPGRLQMTERPSYLIHIHTVQSTVRNASLNTCNPYRVRYRYCMCVSSTMHLQLADSAPRHDTAQRAAHMYIIVPSLVEGLLGGRAVQYV